MEQAGFISCDSVHMKTQTETYRGKVPSGDTGRGWSPILQGERSGAVFPSQLSDKTASKAPSWVFLQGTETMYS